MIIRNQALIIHVATYLCFVFMFYSCGLNRRNQAGSTPETAILLDTIDFVISAQETLPYQQPAQRLWDVHHMELDVRFDWEKEEVIGSANLEMSPYFRKLDTICLDAKGMEFSAVNLQIEDSLYPSTYLNTGKELRIILPRAFDRTDTIRVLIDYIARPSALEKGNGKAITSSQGLYFINPRKTVKEKPSQIWTQGETTYNSGWFPCIDEPYEKFTQEVFITVASQQQTLSNGKLMYSSLNDDGSRTDYWKQSLPHSTYLVMLAIGEWAIEKDNWNNLPVWYYVDSAYIDDARAIFGNTPEMMTFYSDLLGVPYPWEKYHQVVVKDFVSGAMENTTAVIHGDFVQRTARELLDVSYEDVIAHELFHHWFGDLVTCESWPQLTMNEGFATYGEFLWKQYKYGEQAARHHLHKDAIRYFTDAKVLSKPLIRYRFEQADDMFDSHSYQKGGLTLHMLRKEIGDDAFFNGLQHYLKAHAFGTVEDDDLRQSLEFITGQDLRWFFDDWYHMPGHPVMLIDWQVDTLNRMLQLVLKQEQNSPRPFRQHAEVCVAYPTRIDTHRVWIDDWEKRFDFSIDEAPIWFAVDPNHDLLWERKETKPSQVWLNQLASNEGYFPLFDAQEALVDLNFSSKQDLRVEEALMAIAKGRNYYDESRLQAIGNVFKIGIKDTNRAVLLMKEASISDPYPMVRALAFQVLDSILPTGLTEALLQQGLNDTSFHVMRTVLSIMLENDPCKGLAYTEQFSDVEWKKMLTWVSRLHAKCGSAEGLIFFQTYSERLSGFEKFLFNNDFGNYALLMDKEDVFDALVKNLANEAVSETSWWVRLSAIQSLEKARSFYDTEIEKLSMVNEPTGNETVRLAILRNKKASVAAIIEEAKELQGEDEQLFIEP